MTKKISQSLSVGYHFRTGYRKFRSETSLVEMTTGEPYWSVNGNDIDNHSKSLGRTGQFLVTSFGILFFFIVYGYLQGQGSPDFGHRMTVIIKVRSASLDSPKIPWKKNYFHMVILNRIFGNWHFYNFFIIPSALLLRQNYFKNQETVNPNFHNTSTGLKRDYSKTLSDWSTRRSLRAPSSYPYFENPPRIKRLA